MFQNALDNSLTLPPELISDNLADLLKLLLHKDPNRRVTKGESFKIKTHLWCQDINW